MAKPNFNFGQYYVGYWEDSGLHEIIFKSEGGHPGDKNVHFINARGQYHFDTCLTGRDISFRDAKPAEIVKLNQAILEARGEEVWIDRGSMYPNRFYTSKGGIIRFHEGDDMKSFFIDANGNFSYGINCTSTSEFRASTPEEVIKLASKLPDNLHFKVGDYVTVTKVPEGKDHWLNDTEQRTFKIEKDRVAYYGGGFLFKAEGHGGLPNTHVRLATQAEIDGIAPELPVINGYKGKLSESGNYIEYGCAKLSVGWFTASENRYIESLVLNSKVAIDNDQLRQIARYLNHLKK